jgi:hypothetical protein
MTKVTGLRAETSATPAIATLSVAVAAAGHVLAGGSASLAVAPQLLALAAIAWSLGEHLSGRRWWSVGLLATLQLTTHLTLEAGHRTVAPAVAAPMDHATMSHSSMHDMAGMSMPEPIPAAHNGLTDALTMSAAHLLVLLLGVALVTQAHRWVHRVAGILGRLVLRLPAAPVGLPGVRAVLGGVPEVPRLAQRWLVSGMSRRGPPECGVLAASY